MKRALALCAVLFGACEGPTLEVGELTIAESDGGDDAARPFDGGAHDARIRDANFGDRDLHLDELHTCFGDADCLTQTYRRYCSPTVLLCVECTKDEHCGQGMECVQPAGYCRAETSSGSSPGGPPSDTQP